MDVSKLLNIAADSQKIGDWGDSLTFIVNSTINGSTVKALDDDDLMQVAGGQACVVEKKTKGQN